MLRSPPSRRRGLKVNATKIPALPPVASFAEAWIERPFKRIIFPRHFGRLLRGGVD